MNDKVLCSSTKLIRGGTAYSSSPFELNLQLHGQVSNPYSFGIKQNYKSSAATKVIIPPYTEKSWTTPGTYTWTVPAGVTHIRVAVCGGGGGAACSRWNHSENHSGKAGSTSSIKNGDNVLIQATGGGGAASSSNVATAGTGGTPNGNAGSRSTQSVAVTTNGGTGFEMSFSKTSGTYGRGSGVKGSSNYTNSQASGGSGGYNTKYIDVPALTTLTISIGNYGNSSVYNAYPPPTINNGTSGFVLIAYGEGIE